MWAEMGWQTDNNRTIGRHSRHRNRIDATQSALLAMSAKEQAVLAEMGWQTDNNRTIGRHSSHRNRLDATQSALLAMRKRRHAAKGQERNPVERMLACRRATSSLKCALVSY